MSRRAIVRRLLGHELVLKAHPPPDFTGMTPEAKLLWEAKHGQYEAIVTLANEGYTPKMVTPAEHEAELRAAGQWPVEETMALVQLASNAENVTPVPEARAPAEISPQQQYIEEKCQWRHRGPDDYDWDERPRGYECEYEYDPLERGWQEIMRSR